MRAGLITGRERLEFREFPLPEEAPPGAAVVAVGLCGICGADVVAFKDGEPYAPVLSGHEYGGTVVSVGEGVTDLAPGDRVVAGVPPACGRCRTCLAGLAHRCEGIFGSALGSDPLTPQHGAYAQRVTVRAARLIRIPESLDFVQAAMVEPATVAQHAVNRRPPRIGETVAVLGAGPVGLFAAQWARIAGARVVVVEPSERRRKMAQEIGADEVVEPGADALAAVRDTTNGLGAAVVYDCAGSRSSLLGSPELTRPGGAIMLVGVSHAEVPAPLRALLIKELDLMTSLAHLHHEFGTTIDAMARGALLAAPLHDLTVTLDELSGALAELAGGRDRVKVLVDPSGG